MTEWISSHSHQMQKHAKRDGMGLLVISTMVSVLIHYAAYVTIQLDAYRVSQIHTTMKMGAPVMSSFGLIPITTVMSGQMIHNALTRAKHALDLIRWIVTNVRIMPIDYRMAPVPVSHTGGD